jgi:hypothetical protein
VVRAERIYDASSSSSSNIFLINQPINKGDEIMLKKLLCGATLVCAAGFANAATITLSDTVAVSTTNFTTSLNFAKFDTMGGTRVLESVTFAIDGSIFGSAEVESRDNAATTVVTTLSAELTLIDALSNTLVVTIPSITNIFNATAFDGVLDFGGTSGNSYLGLTANQYEDETYTDIPTLTLFTATGMDTTANLTFHADATSSATGAGNLTSAFNTSAGGLVSVIYEYRVVPVSAPAIGATVGFGLLLLTGLRRSSK